LWDKDIEQTRLTEVLNVLISKHSPYLILQTSRALASGLDSSSVCLVDNDTIGCGSGDEGNAINKVGCSCAGVEFDE